VTLRIEYDTHAFDYPDVAVPKVWTVRQKVEAPVLADIEGAARAAVRELATDPRLRAGASVAVGVGSRGIANLVPVVRAVISELKALGTEPFIVPAMGSHGGAVAEGQREILHDYGITYENVGAEIRATMEVKQVAALEDGYPVYFDCNALSADAVLVINRIKHHTDFAGEIESGICKMCAIGLGKQKGAATIHRFGAEGLRDTMPAVGRKLVETVNIVGGIALIENPYGETAEIHPVGAPDVGREKETRLLERARQLAPRLAFDEVDVLVVDEMGKNISGSGMDTHVIGRLAMPSVDEATWDGPSVRVICVLDLTDKSHGNAAGLGLADMVTQKLIKKVDFSATFTNHRTSGEGGVYRSRLPIILDNAEACVRTAVGACGRGLRETVRLARIRNTEFVDTLEISEALLAEAHGREDLEILSGPHAPDLDRPLPGAH
jgi:hypothetical protein